MSFVDAYYDRHKNMVKVVERVDGNRIFRETVFEHVLYYEHPAGSQQSIFGDPCRKFSTTDPKKFRKEQMRLKDKGIKVFESDIRETFRHLADNYMGADAPKLHVCFFDIETDFIPEKGFAPPEDPFAPITAISLHLSHLDRMITLALVPPTLTPSAAQELVNAVYDDSGKLISGFEDTMIFDNEMDMLDAFLSLVEDVDVFSGWNSEGFDIPYTVNRIKRVLGEDATKKLCLWDLKPREREYIKFGKTSKTYDLIGKVHLDYLVLYQKHVTQQQQSYKLDYIGEMEVGENKTVYEGTLDSLYKNDFYRFIEYNRQDVGLLVKIDQKKRYIELHNQIAHANCVDLKTTVGSVALVETAIINEMHAMGFVVPNRKAKDIVHPDDEEERAPVVGAYVAEPKTGIHYEIGCIDLNSLYPSTLRALNMSPETIMGQIRSTETDALVETRIMNGTPRAEAWAGLFSTVEVSHMMAVNSEWYDFTDEITTIPPQHREWGWKLNDNHLSVEFSNTKMITIDFENGKTVTCTAKEFRDHIFNPANNLCVTANGTLFRTDKEGIIPKLLAKWYSERKALQRKEREFAKLAESGIEIDAELAALLQ